MEPATDRLRIVPLGGLGEIGMNCLALEHDDDIVLVDCGTRFPTDDCGIDVIHPDFSWLRQHRQRVRGLVLTHGHEDHIGALPYLLEDLDIPVYGPRHALRVAMLRLGRHDFAPDEVSLNELGVGARLGLGSFEFEPIRVSHSIVEATALVIRTRAGTVLHTGDFKFDRAPSDGQLTDEARLAEVGVEGIDVLLSDSTNSDEVGESGSEGEVADHLEQAVARAPARAIVALFASNVQRLISLGRVALATGRRLCALGTSLVRHIEIARDLGHLDWPADLLLPPERARTYPKRELLVLASGTQAEPGSALWRLAQGNHRFLDLEPRDSVIFSSRIIPGHERQVVTLICDLLRRGAEVEWGRRSRAHTSGHACRAEQERMIRLTAPKAFVPVHGTLHHLRRHAALARELGIEQVDVIENGQTIVLEGGRIRRGATIEAGEVRVGFAGEVLDADVLQRRKELARGGHVLVFAQCERRGRKVRELSLRSSGVAFFDEPERSRRELAQALERAWHQFEAKSPELLEAEVQRFTGRWLETRYRLRPVVTAVVTVASGKDR